MHRIKAILRERYGDRRMNAIFLLKSKNTVAFLYDDNTLRQGLEKMRVHGYTAMPVITREGKYAGCISEGDFLWHILETEDGTMKGQELHLIRDIVRNGWNPAVSINVEMEALLERAMNQNFVPVIDDRSSFIGIITRKDIIRFFYDQLQKSGNGDREETEA